MSYGKLELKRCQKKEKVILYETDKWKLDKLKRRVIFTSNLKAHYLSEGGTEFDGFIVFVGDVQRVWLDKRTGRVCMSISSSGLAITGIDDRRYWSRIETDESRFKSVAYLQQIWWFEVDGEVDFPFPIGSYCIFFRLQVGRASRKFGRRVCNSDHVHGWDKKPVHFQLSTSDGQQATTQCYLNEPGIWKYHHVGDFAVTSLAKEMKVKFSMTQIDCTHTKGGLCVDSVLICPVEFKDRFKQSF